MTTKVTCGNLTLSRLPMESFKILLSILFNPEHCFITLLNGKWVAYLDMIYKLLSFRVSGLRFLQVYRKAQSD